MNHPGKIQVALSVSSGEMTGITRSADENTIRDLNFYLCDKAGSVVLHRYQTAATLHFECLPGDYTLYVVANMHEDMGDISQAQLMAYAVPHKTDYEDLPMTGLLEISILASQGETVQLPTLEVQRQVAKVAYNIAVMPADIELHSVRICSVPKSAGVLRRGGYAVPAGCRLHGYFRGRRFRPRSIRRLLSAAQSAGYESRHHRPAAEERRQCPGSCFVPPDSGYAQRASADLSGLFGRKQYG